MIRKFLSWAWNVEKKYTPFHILPSSHNLKRILTERRAITTSQPVVLSPVPRPVRSLVMRCVLFFHIKHHCFNYTFTCECNYLINVSSPLEFNFHEILIGFIQHFFQCLLYQVLCTFSPCGKKETDQKILLSWT